MQPDPKRTTGKNGRTSHWLKPGIILVATLVLPAAALVKLSHVLGWQPVTIYLAVLSVITFYMYGSDKHKARKGSWRVPESTLHLLELLGGWAAAFLGQRIFRHKISKGRYQVSFWLIAILHQCLALDYLVNWQFSSAIFQFLKSFFS